MKKANVVFFLVLVLISGCFSLKQDFNTLLDIKKDQDHQKIYLDDQRKNFDRIVSAMKKREIKSGALKREIASSYGLPALLQQDKELEKWVYQDPYETNPINGKKVRLYFDAESRLVKWACSRIECA